MNRLLQTIIDKLFAKSTLYFAALLLATLSMLGYWKYLREIKALSEEGQSKLDLYVMYLHGVLQRYESLPELLAADEKIVHFFSKRTEPDETRALNIYLQSINTISDTADIYVMNRVGVTLAASNWLEKTSFVGHNFSYRPYFTEAMQGIPGKYFALGTTSSRRGYYFSQPVRSPEDGSVLGVVVVKINIDLVENTWEGKDKIFLVSDPDGVIFITTKQQWRFYTLSAIAPEEIQRIVASNRYPNASFRRLVTSHRQLDSQTELVTVASYDNENPRSYLALTKAMPEADWNVHIFTEIRTVHRNVLLTLLVAAFVMLLSYVLWLLLRQRRFRLAELDKVKEHNRLALQQANEELELRVARRTQELTDSNSKLRTEIIERQKTEIDLKKTRDELVQAAKMAALGQLSAGINHELNQPLAAIRSYSDNGKQLLRMGRNDEALWNLEQIGELTERMAHIGAQLKMFSRKSSGQIQILPLRSVIDGALEILRPSLRNAGAQVTINLDPDDLQILANSLLLQQVLINVIGNACQAIEESILKKISLSARREADAVIIDIRDSGPGLVQNDVTQIFEPFHTTKKSGQGLGLGLTISKRILREMDGDIEAIAAATGGACFQIRIPGATRNA